MTMAKSFTEFHMDFGGSSVWYHIQKGAKYFFFVEPTRANIDIYEHWITAHRAGTDTGFFGNVLGAKQCQCVLLEQGCTLILPSGWLHAVYTPTDSLVFGGNFVHEYAIGTQLDVWAYEERQQVQKRFRYPHFVQTLWYFVADLIKRTTGHEYVRLVREHEIDRFIANKTSNRRYDTEVEPNEFYDIHAGDPWQVTFDACDSEPNECPATINYQYLKHYNQTRCAELIRLHEFLANSLRKKPRRRAAEGIRRPRHLLNDFKYVLDKLSAASDVCVSTGSSITVDTIAQSPTSLTSPIAQHSSDPNVPNSSLESPLVIETPTTSTSATTVSPATHSSPLVSPPKSHSPPVASPRSDPSKTAKIRKRRSSGGDKQNKPKLTAKQRLGDSSYLPPSISLERTQNDPIYLAVPLGKPNTAKNYRSNFVYCRPQNKDHH